MKIKIEGGILYDSKNGINGEQRDIFIDDGIIVDGFSKPDKTIHAKSKTIMAGGIDIHSHIATYGLNLLRATHGFYLPREIGHIYAKMGYTHVNEPFMTQYTASYVHHELSSIPIVDTSAFLVLNIKDLDRKIKSTRYIEEVERIIPVIMSRAKAIGLKIYEPFVRYAQRMYIMKNVKASKVLSFFSGMNKENIPRIILHSSSGLFKEEIENPSLFHFSHIGSTLEDEDAYNKVLTYLDEGASADLGLFDFEENTRISTGRFTDYTFCGVVDMDFSEPISFSQGKIHDLTPPFLTLKLALSEPNKHISFSSDSPTNAIFESYPKILSWLMSIDNRKDLFKRDLPDFEYTLFDIARVTRQNPADILGLSNKGHLGVGAQADIAIYDIHNGTKANELESRFKECAYLIKSGEVVIEDHRIINNRIEKNTYFKGVEPCNDGSAKELAKYSTFRFEHLFVEDVFTAKEVKV
ncbi:MAG: amidohydrolase family protein [Thermodesulfobacteriota bacterium]|nr:amidohydrolase family protein [Thermodesulfobacteriota bacterium]